MPLKFRRQPGGVWRLVIPASCSAGIKILYVSISWLRRYWVSPRMNTAAMHRPDLQNETEGGKGGGRVEGEDGKVCEKMADVRVVSGTC